MTHLKTVFTQILKLVSRHDFEALAKANHSGHSFRVDSKYSQFVYLSIAQLTGRISLSDMIENITPQDHRLLNLGGIQIFTI